MGHAALKDEEIYHTEMPVGEILRRTRAHYGQSLADIERALRIRASQIEAIEEGDHEKLPGRVYAIGFVRSYAEYLGLDGGKMVHLFKIQAGGKSKKPELHFPATASESKTPNFLITVVSVIMAVLILITWWSSQGAHRDVVDEVPQVPAQMQKQAQSPITVPEAAAPEIPVTDVPPTTPPTETQEAAAPAEPSKVQQGIILNIVENSWVEIRDKKSGKSVVSRVLEAGDQYYVPDAPDLTISIGNAGGVKIEIDGKKLAPLGRLGQVQRNIPLDVNYLLKTFAPKGQQ
jgi:cytoskeleton protein RodZ